MLVGVNISDSWLTEAVSLLNCKMGKVPFFYLGLPIGGNPRKLSFWDPVFNHIKSTLSVGVGIGQVRLGFDRPESGLQIFLQA